MADDDQAIESIGRVIDLHRKLDAALTPGGQVADTVTIELTKGDLALLMSALSMTVIPQGGQ